MESDRFYFNVQRLKSKKKKEVKFLRTTHRIQTQNTQEPATYACRLWQWNRKQSKL